MNHHPSIKELGEHIKTWRETVGGYNYLKLVGVLNQRQQSIVWTPFLLQRVEQGDTTLSFEHWMQIFQHMGRLEAVIESAHDLQSLYLAQAESTVNAQEEQIALEKLTQRTQGTPS